jgi:cytochrome c553
MPKGIPLDLTNVRFTRLTAIRLHETNSNKHRVWQCLCECGATVYATVQNLQRGKVKSCGCLKREGLPTRMTHGHSRRGDASGTYSCWQSMRARCNRPSHPSYPTFGGRGITVCKRWMTFENFLADMGVRPRSLQIARLDNDGNFEPKNCKWATVSEKGLDKRTTSKYTVNGITKSFRGWADHLGINRATLFERMQKWTLEKALTTPAQRSKGLAKPRYGRNWAKSRRAAMKAANGTCQRCKKAKAVHIHHKLPVRYFAKPEDAHFPQNLMAVCRPCHKKEHEEMAARFPLLDTLESERNFTRRDNRGLKRFITWRGQTKTAAEWGRSVGNRYPSQYVINRLRRYPFEKAMEPFN